MPTNNSIFTDFYTCNICKETTRHYEKTTHGKQNTQQRTVYCEKCGVLRMQTNRSGTWLFGLNLKT